MLSSINTIQQVCFMDLMHSISPLLDYITQTKIGGVVPLDIPVHFLAGMVLTIIGLKCKLPFWATLILVLLVALAKEGLDSTRMVEYSFIESMKDVAVTLGYPALLCIIRLSKRTKTREYYRGF